MKSSVQTGFVGNQLTSLRKEVGQGQRLSRSRKARNKEMKAGRLQAEAARLNMSVQQLLAAKTREIPTVFSNPERRIREENRFGREEEE